ncbi:DNA-binding anti-repressor SinI [Cytobacillus sp. Hz8]
MNKSISTEELDFEWVELIFEAKKLGMNKDEILSFLRKNKEDEMV